MNRNKINFLAHSLPALFILVLVSVAQAQQPATVVDATKNVAAGFPKMFLEPMTYLWLLLLVIVIATLIALSRAVHVLTKILEEKTTGVPVKQAESKEYLRGETGWDKLMKMLTRSVPIEQEADVMLDHNYDGIRELDNKLPPWWKWGFVLTIIFAFIYLVNYHVSGSGKLQSAEYADEIKAAEIQKVARMTSSAGFLSAANVTLLKDESSLSDGKKTFMTLCSPCHGQQGQGMVGPNLTDVFWLHGGGIKDLFTTITEGVPVKGMISWKNQLSPKQIQVVASYILSLQGTNPPGAKEPQGDKWVESGNPAPPDSSSVKKDTIAVTKS